MTTVAPADVVPPVDVVEFLRRQPPFDTLSAQELQNLAALVEVDTHPSGQTIFEQGAGAVQWVWVVRDGAVELLFDGRVLDLVSSGEMFGQASMLSGLPTGFTARTAEPTRVYRIPAAAVHPLLTRPRVLRFLVRSMIEDAVPGAGERLPTADPLQRRAGALIQMPLVVCGPEESVRDVARVMSNRGVSAVVVVANRVEPVGIVTSTDLRAKVIAAGLDPSSPVSAIMSAPVHSMSPDRVGGDVLLEMLDRGVQHMLVRTPNGRMVGVLEDHDLVSLETRTPFVLSRRIARATGLDEVVEAAQGLLPAVVALRRSGARAQQISALWSAVVDALTRRLLDLAVAQAGPPPVPFTWLALGSLARREATPASDVDSAVTWAGHRDDEPLRTYLGTVTKAASAGLLACGLRGDDHRVSGADPMFTRSLSQWQSVADGLIKDPWQRKGLIITSVLLDNRAVWGGDRPHGLTEPLLVESPERTVLLNLMAREALSHRPPTGFMRDFVVESSGERRGRLDLKRGGVQPIVDLARWAGLSAGVGAASTPARLRAAKAAGVLHADDADTLREAFTVFTEVDIDHQVEQVDAGMVPDNFIKPGQLSSIGRAQLKEAFRALASVQRGLSADIQRAGR